MASDKEHRSPVTRIFKIVGYATALLTLGFGISRVWVAIEDYGERRHEVDELLATAEVLMIGANYQDAWESVSEADELDPSTRVRERLEDVAMAWLRDARVQEPTEFEGLVAPLVSVITRGVTLSEGPRRADLLSHLGYAGFLRWRATGNTGFERYYEEALAIDPANPFANTFAAAWILWPPSGSAEDAAAHFTAALESGRERAFVRNMQMFALGNATTLENTEMWIRMAADLHASGEPPPTGFADRLWQGAYARVMSNPADRRRAVILAAVPASTHAEMFETFVGTGSRAYRDSRWERDLWLAAILEQGGETERARTLLEETLRFVETEMPDINARYPELIREAIVELHSTPVR